MIIPNQSNIKVHYAGLENQEFAQILNKLSGVKYGLFTVFPFISRMQGIKGYKFSTVTDQCPIFLQENFRHVIMDSGLFTLMFGAHSGRRDAAFIEEWYRNLTEFVLRVGFTGTVVEVDCQKVLGVEKAKEFRRRMKKDLPNNRQINVFHIDDGQKGLDEMIEFSEYIAVSVPELRKLGKKNHCVKLVNYIKNKKPSIDIHLLGCTENKLLHELNFATSSDSTAWQQVGRYGELKMNLGDGTQSIHNKQINKDLMKKTFSPHLENELSNWWEELTEKQFDYYSKYALAGQATLKQYAHYGGDQS